MPPLQLRLSHALMLALLVVAAIFGLKAKAAAADARAARAESSRVRQEIQALQAGVAASNAALERLEAQGKALQRRVDVATGEALHIQREAGRQVDQLLRSKATPEDAAGALAWAHSAAAEAANSWEARP